MLRGTNALYIVIVELLNVGTVGCPVAELALPLSFASATACTADGRTKWVADMS